MGLCLLPQARAPLGRARVTAGLFVQAQTPQVITAQRSRGAPTMRPGIMR